MSKDKSVREDRQPRRCVYCGRKSPVIWVHGHGQCAACGINIEECCRGEQCEVVSSKSTA